MTSAPGGRQLFVYYRVALPDLGACVQAVRGLQAGLQRTHPDLQCALLQRPESEDADGQRTLMECYARPGGIDAVLQAHIAHAATAALALLVLGPRHVEIFEPCA
ncbi:DUF4936 family protein [Azohydromonas caseinilytica]|uniref:DUF4936 family protein n=1 Tax=Azohydromonas caseinilytica TaxID=2728836 RepID=A0A848FGM1_9BURK|nr:DUF4936 family protein [Azohydromonas caseinilytica]NML17403.1 DUF4936 family protein [Azohydromonas caseinilytica]